MLHIRWTIALSLLVGSITSAAGQDVVWIEAEQFDDCGRWSNDSQHVDLMGSPYLLATGVGKPVADATATVKISAEGEYRLWVRCRDWLPSHSPGLFQVMVGGKPSAVTFGKADSDAWQWVDGGTFDLAAGDVELRLHDLTGWWGRCDAVVLATDGFKPAEDLEQIATQRLKYLGTSASVEALGPFDVVVVGGGSAGIGAALASARNGCKVAFIQDRPVLGGNASSEISVPPMGYIGSPPDRVNVSGIAKEVFPKQGWHNFADSAKIERIVRAEENISLFLNTRATGVEMDGKDKIKAVLALDVHNGRRMAFAAPRFIDCTGHGWIGYYAGAEYRMGQEARAEFGETLAPVEAGKRTMGNSLYKAVIVDHRPGGASSPAPSSAPGEIVKYSNKAKVTVTGDWTHSTFMGGDYLFHGEPGKANEGKASVDIMLGVNKPGRYKVFLGYLAWSNRATSVPVTVEHADGKATVTVNQTLSTDGWKLLGTFRLGPNAPARVTVGTAGTTGCVIADCVRVLSEDAKDPKAPEPKAPEVAEGVPFDCPAWAYQWKKASDFETGGHHRIREIRRPGNYDVPSHGKGRSPGNSIDGAITLSWWIEYGGMVNTVDDAEEIRDELLRITMGMWNYAKNHNPNTVARNKYRELVWVNYVPGVRESRRLVGDYIMSQRDFDLQTIHPDTVAFTDWGIDVHHPEGYWVQGNDCIHVYQGRRVSIPYRSLYSKNIANLFMAGRCHSATHMALGGTRVMRPMCATGQAAGTAAAIAHQHQTTPRGVCDRHLSQLQQTLLRDGCYLLGVDNTDPADLARTARVSASSSAEGLAPAKVIDGWNRVVDGDRHAWAPAAEGESPTWLAFQLERPAAIGEVHVTAEDSNVDFAVEAMIDGGWQAVAKSTGNSARRVVLRFDPVTTAQVRIIASSLPSLCEVRIYE
ncbi:MAG: FAD-dependent oxidoreductase [Planctomycetes bacterium]|nr:FAD-dependent oxidoreductase [Planctomycetota bacterium]